jgi:hypothetical protein
MHSASTPSAKERDQIHRTSAEEATAIDRDPRIRRSDSKNAETPFSMAELFEVAKFTGFAGASPQIAVLEVSIETPLHRG